MNENTTGQQAQVVEVTKQIKFSAAHELPRHKGKCRQMHGHTFALSATVSGPVQPLDGHATDGMVVDFGFLGQALRRLHGVLDHKILNDFDEYPTAERVASRCAALLQRWIAHRAHVSGCKGSAGFELREVRLHEEFVEPSCSASVRPAPGGPVGAPTDTPLCRAAAWGFNGRRDGLATALASATEPEGRLLRAAACLAEPQRGPHRLLVSYEEAPAMPGWTPPATVALALAGAFLWAKGLDVAIAGPGRIWDAASLLSGGEATFRDFWLAMQADGGRAPDVVLIDLDSLWEPGMHEEMRVLAAGQLGSFKGSVVALAPSWLLPGDPSKGLGFTPDRVGSRRDAAVRLGLLDRGVVVEL